MFKGKDALRLFAAMKHDFKTAKAGVQSRKHGTRTLGKKTNVYSLHYQRDL